MIDWIKQAEFGIRELAGIVPLEIFVFFGAFAEELVAPIPSMLVMTTVGFFAQLEGRTTFFLVWLVLLGNIGKLLGSFIYYTVGDRAEDILTGRFGRYIGVKHEDIERIGRKLSGGSPWRDGAIIYILRVIPFVPTTAVSIACGVIRVRLKAFLIASYCGNFSKDLFYAFAGYYGVRQLRAFFMDIERVRFGLSMLIVIIVIGILALLYIYRHHGFRLFRRVIDFFKPSRD